MFPFQGYGNGGTLPLLGYGSYVPPEPVPVIGGRGHRGIERWIHTQSLLLTGKPQIEQCLNVKRLVGKPITESQQRLLMLGKPLTINIQDVRLQGNARLHPAVLLALTGGMDDG